MVPSKATTGACVAEAGFHAANVIPQLHCASKGKATPHTCRCMGRFVRLRLNNRVIKIVIFMRTHLTCGNLKRDSL